MVGVEPVVQQDASRVRNALVSAGAPAFTASRNAGTQGAVRNLAATSSSSVCASDQLIFSCVASIFARTRERHVTSRLYVVPKSPKIWALAPASYLIVTSSVLVVSFPRMSITFTTTLYFPAPDI